MSNIFGLNLAKKWQLPLRFTFVQARVTTSTCEHCMRQRTLCNWNIKLMSGISICSFPAFWSLFECQASRKNLSCDSQLPCQLQLKELIKHSSFSRQGFLTASQNLQSIIIINVFWILSYSNHHHPLYSMCLQIGVLANFDHPFHVWKPYSSS